MAVWPLIVGHDRFVCNVHRIGSPFDDDSCVITSDVISVPSYDIIIIFWDKFTLERLITQLICQDLSMRRY